MFQHIHKFFPCQLILRQLIPFVILLCTSASVVAHGSITTQNLKGIQVPMTPGLVGKSAIVVNKEVAVQLGKSLFWDVNVGSNGVACATCHFHAGSDRRTRNQLSSGKLHLSDSDSANSFEINENPGYELKLDDFPLFRFSDSTDKYSALLFSTDDVVGSAGVFLQKFQSVRDTGESYDQCQSLSDEIFSVNNLNTRQVTNRNAPTIINAAFNFRNFWDGRANNIFNGVNAFGRRDVNAKIWAGSKGKNAKKVSISLLNASLASQALAPPLDMIEMSCQGRTFQEIGKKLLQRRPLETQKVHAEDSVLGGVSDSSGYGLNTTYADLIKKAFSNRYWAAKGNFGISSSGTPYSQLEANFALFFGLAIQLYEDTLISDQAPIDSPLNEETGFPTGLNEQQQRGLIVFQDAHCNNCHSGPTFSAAINPQVYAQPGKILKYVKLVDRTVLTEQSDNFGVDRTLIDVGFADTSVVPNAYDVGLGGKDPFGNPLSFVEQYVSVLANKTKSMIDPINVLACEFVDTFVEDFLTGELVPDKKAKQLCNAHKTLSKIPSPAIVTAELSKTDQGRMSMNTVGAFKIPTLRNVELTGPYMHNGGMKSLEEVVDFYNRGGNLDNRRHSSTLVFPQGFTEQNKSDLVAFLKALTDERVRWERAPFDHPEIYAPHGHETEENPVLIGAAKDLYLHIPAVGKNGRSPELGPLKAFDNYLKP